MFKRLKIRSLWVGVLVFLPEILLAENLTLNLGEGAFSARILTLIALMTVLSKRRLFW